MLKPILAQVGILTKYALLLAFLIAGFADAPSSQAAESDTLANLTLQQTKQQLKSLEKIKKSFPESVPSDFVSVYNELTKISDYRKQISPLQSLDQLMIDQGDNTSFSLDSVKSQDCTTDRGRTTVSANVNNASGSFDRYVNDTDTIVQDIMSLNSPTAFLTDADQTKLIEAKDALKSVSISPISIDHPLDLQQCSTAVANVSAVLGKLNAWRGVMNDFKQRIFDSFNQTVDDTISALDARQKSLSDQAASKTAEDQIRRLLPVLMIVILVSSMLILGGIKLFDREMQREWIESGQVIQFSTAMALLSIIMTLGLSGVLNGETVGTLLGGIAGYVLAQGVGKASSRDATKQAENWARAFGKSSPETGSGQQSAGSVGSNEASVTGVTTQGGTQASP